MREDLKLLITATSFIRLLLICGVFLVNLFSFLKVIFVFRKNFISSFCVHRATIAAILCSNMIYLCTWMPYLFSSHQTGHWPFPQQKEHCIVQYTITGQVTTVLLAVLSIRKLYNYFSVRKARLITLSLIIAWLIPQSVYLNVVDLMNQQKSSQFLDRLLFTPHGTHERPESLPQNHIGFMLCIQKLAKPIISQLSWHYVVLVIPLTAIIFLCSVGQALRQSKTKNHEISCNCPSDFIVSIALYFNLMWLILLRPLIVLQTLVMSSESEGSPPTYLDFGTHLVLIFSCLSIPFSSSGGFRSLDLSSSSVQSSNNSCCNQSRRSSISFEYESPFQEGHKQPTEERY